MPEKNNYISIGKIVKPVGLKGNIKAVYLTDFPDRFLELKNVCLFDEKNNFFYENKESSFDFIISECKVSNSFVNLKLVGIDRKEDADKLKNLIIMIREDLRIKIPDDQFYFYEIINADVYDKDKFLGKLEKVVNYGSGDLLIVNFNNTELMIPLRKEFIVKIDLKNKRIDTDLIEGFY